MPVEDTMTEGARRIEKLKKKIEETLTFYRDLQKAPLPKKIEAISDEVEAATERFVPKLNAKLLQLWKKRAVKIEKVNEQLQLFEYTVCQQMTASAEAVIVGEIHKVLRKFEWFAGHIGEITLLLAASLGYADGLYGDDFRSQVGRALSGGCNGDWSQFEDAMSKVGDTGAAMVEILAESAALGLLAQVLEGSIVALSAGKYSLSLPPVFREKAAAEQGIEDSAFPQGTKRKTRRKTQRKGIGR